MADTTIGEPGRRRPLIALTGALTLVYVVWYAVDLVVLGVDPELFNGVHRLSDGLVPRLALATAGLGVVHHAASGLGGAAIDLWPRLDRHRVGFEALARFTTLALGVPGAVAVVWPAVRAWWVR